MVHTPNVQQQKRLVAIFKNHEDIENAIRAMKKADFDMNHVSVLARNIEDVAGGREVNEAQGNEAREGAGIGATTGTVLGGVTGFLIGVGVLAIPGVGPILAAGAEISALASTLAGAGIGAATGGIVGALVGLGIPEEQARVYENRIKAGDYLLMISGDDDTLRRAESMMGDHHADSVDSFAVPTTEMRPRRVETGAHFEGQPVSEPSGQPGTATRDLDRDGEPEVVVIDERQSQNRP